MAANIYKILADPDFQALPFESKKKVLGGLNPSFAELPDESQINFMRGFNLVRPEGNQELRPLSSAVSDVARPALEGLGGAAGAIAAGALSSPMAAGGPTAAGIPLAVAAGGALGVAAGRGAADYIDRLTGLKPPVPDVLAAVDETIGNITYGAASEATGVAGGRAFAKVGAPFAKATAKQGARAIEAMKRLGVELLPGEINHSGTLNLIENVLGYLPISRDVFQRYRFKQVESMINQREALLSKNASDEAIEAIGVRIQDMLDGVFRKEAKLGSDKATMLKNELLRKMGSTQGYEELGMAAQEAIKRKSEMMSKASEALYRNASEHIDPSSSIVPTNVRQKAMELLKMEQQGAPSLQDQEAMEILSDLSGWNSIQALRAKYPNGDVPQELIDEILNRPVGYQYLAQTRSALGRVIGEHDASYRYSKAGQGSKFVSDRTAGVAKQLFGAIDNDLYELAAANGDDAVKALEVARAFYKQSKEQFDSKAVKSVLAANPEKVLDIIVRPGQTTQIKHLRGILGPEEWPNLKRKFVSRLADFGRDAPIDGAELRRRVDGYGQETLATIFSKDEIDSLYSMADLLEKANASDLLDNTFFKSIARSSPEKVIDVIVKPRNTVNIEKIRSAIGEDGISRVREGLIQKLLVNESVDSHGNFSAIRLDSALNRYSERTLRSVLPKEVVDSLKDMGTVGSRMAKAYQMAGNPSGTAQNIVAYQQGELLLQNPVLGVKVMLPQYMLARLYLNPSTRKYLTEGLFTSISSEKAGELSGRLISSVVAMGADFISKSSE